MELKKQNKKKSRNRRLWDG